MTTLVKLLKVSEYDRLNFDYGYSEGMENAEGSYGILNFMTTTMRLVKPHHPNTVWVVRLHGKIRRSNRSNNKHRQSGLWTRQSTIRSLFPRWSPLVLEEWIEPEIEYNAF